MTRLNDKGAVHLYTVQHLVCRACGHPVTAITESALFAAFVDHEAVCKRG